MTKTTGLLIIGALALAASGGLGTRTAEVVSRDAQGNVRARGFSTTEEGVKLINDAIRSGRRLVSKGRTLDVIPRDVVVEAAGKTYRSGQGTISRLADGSVRFLGAAQPARDASGLSSLDRVIFNNLKRADPGLTVDAARARGLI